MYIYICICICICIIFEQSNSLITNCCAKFSGRSEDWLSWTSMATCAKLRTWINPGWGGGPLLKVDCWRLPCPVVQACGIQRCRTQRDVNALECFKAVKAVCCSSFGPWCTCLNMLKSRLQLADVGSLACLFVSLRIQVAKSSDAALLGNSESVGKMKYKAPAFRSWGCHSLLKFRMTWGLWAVSWQSGWSLELDPPGNSMFINFCWRTPLYMNLNWWLNLVKSWFFKVNHPFFHSFSQMWPPVTIRRPKSMGRSASPNTWNASWRTSATANPKRIKVASKPWRRSSTGSCPGWTRPTAKNGEKEKTHGSTTLRRKQRCIVQIIRYMIYVY